MSSIIEINGLGKKYPIVHDKVQYGTLRDSLMGFAKNPFAKQTTHEEFWALKDIDLSIEKGDIVGIIGKNGAGKSTLLKIIAGIAKPTEGNVKLYGRISSLLEVGTGFHPELTGRENIFLNGVILGMTRKEVAKKFDQIVDFAGIEKFLDTPVKHYSSGMYVRLAFAVAAHLEPDILIVDEVLAVGDAEFQKKCLGKMEDVSKKEGRTVLFVSHNMQAISSLTKQCLYLNGGHIRSYGETTDVTSQYLSNISARNAIYVDETPYKQPRITEVEAVTSLPSGVHEFGKRLSFKIKVETKTVLRGAAVSFKIINSLGISTTHILTLDSEIPLCRTAGSYELVCTIPRPRLYPDNYSLTVYFAEKSTETLFETLQNVCHFEVIKIDEFRDYYWGVRNAVYIEDGAWVIKKHENL